MMPTTTNYQQIIAGSLNNCLDCLILPNIAVQSGKVRDSYRLNNQLMIITTDRQSAFDRQLALIPFKGQVLNQCSAWWFEQTRHIIDNHLIAIPDPNVMLVKPCHVFSIEVIVRGYITGSTHTSLWTQYQKGIRNYCGHDLDDGLKKNQLLQQNIITPTTKSDQGDIPISAQQIVDQTYISAEEWQFIEEKALALFQYGQEVAAKHGLILVDTKYEFGKDDDGNILLVDELHTPDSSRYWLADSYQQCFDNGEEPENIDKEFLRLWFAKHCDPYHDDNLPPAPQQLIIELASRYISLYEKISGNNFIFPNSNSIEQRSDSIEQRIISNIKNYIE